MGLLIQNKLIQYILQPIAHLTNRIPAKLRDVLFVCAGCWLFYNNALYNAALARPRYLVTVFFGCLAVGIMLLCTLPATIKPIRFDKRVMIPWFGFSLLMLISSFTNSVDYLADVPLFLVMFPVVYLVWNNGDVRRIMRLFAWICRVSFGGFFLFSIFFYPPVGHGYMSNFTNPNGFSFFLTGIFCFLLISVLASRPTAVLFWVDLFFVGVIYAFIYYSNSRTGQLALIIPLSLTFGLLLLQGGKQFWKPCLTHILPTVLSLTVLYTGTLYVVQGAQWLRITAFPVIEQYVGGSSFWPAAGDSFTSIQQIEDSVSQQQSAETNLNRDPDQISSGRVSIWKAYLPHLNLRGHRLDERFSFVDVEGNVQAENTTAHMCALEMAYQHGVLAGVLFLAFNLIAGVKGIFYALRHRKDRWALLPFTVSLSFGVVSVLSSTVSPFLYMIALCYFLVQTPLVVCAEEAAEAAPAA